MASDISDLYFGHPAATQDAYLDKYFISTGAFKNISDLSDPRCVVVGKKGCGKSALFTKLAESSSKSRLVVRISPDTHQVGSVADYSYRQYSNLFQYEIMLEVLKNFCDNEDTHKRFDAEFVLRARMTAGEYVKILKGIKGKLGKLTGIQIFGCGLSTSEDKDKVIRLVAAQGLDNLRSIISEILKNKIEILVLIDDPDLLFGEVDRPVDIVGGLLLAGISLSSHASRKFKVCTLVKQHKYELLSWEFEDFDKISQNVLVVSWQDTELDSLLIERIKFREQLLPAATAMECWSKAFEVKNQASIDAIKNYIYPRLTNGPRDLIKFGNAAMKATRERRKNLISKEVLDIVEADYSKDCLKEVGREFNGPYPGIVSVIVKLFDHPELRKGDRIARSVMEKVLSERYRAEEVQSEKKDKRWLAEAYGSLLVEILFKVGVVGFFSSGHPSVPVMSYSPGSFGDSFQNAKEFFVHPAYRKSLGI